MAPLALLSWSAAIFTLADFLKWIVFIPAFTRADVTLQGWPSRLRW